MTNMIVRNRAQVNPWNDIEKVWDSYYRAAEAEPRKPVVQINNEDSRVSLTVELPGFGPEDMDIQVKENLLTIQALRKVEQKDTEDEEVKAEKNVVFEKSFVLPEDLNRDHFEAEMKNGLLTLELPRREKPAPLTIKVKA